MTNYFFDAVIFDLDGVITQTAQVHSTAWKKMFDEYLKLREKKYNESHREFSHEEDYLPYVDGKPRYKGVESFLKSRNINIEYGDAQDLPHKETICGLGNRKNELFNKYLKDGVAVFESTISLIKDLKNCNIRIGVASSSKNCQAILQAADIEHYFETRVDGVVSKELGLAGKPEPDIFMTACDNLNIQYNKAIVVEDAVSGVQAGAKGNFGLVLGIAREQNEKELKKNGADIVVKDLDEINITTLQKWFEEEWSICYTDYDKEKERHRESLLALGNGYLGVRGAMEEMDANNINYPGTYIAGVYNALDTKIAGRIVTNEDFVNIPNWKYINFQIEQEKLLDINKTKIIEIKRQLDLQNGCYSKKLKVNDENNNKTLIESKHIASMDNPHLAALKYSITPNNYSKTLTIISKLDGNILNAGVDRYKTLNSKHLQPVSTGGNNNISYLQVKTSQSNINIAQAAKLIIKKNDEQIFPKFQIIEQEGQIISKFNIELKQGEDLCIEKLVSIYTSNDKNVTDPLQNAQNTVENLENFDAVFQQSCEKWRKIWKKINIKNNVGKIAKKLLRLHCYHLLVTASSHNKNIDAGIPARGLHGEAYRGHIFWDELFILPFYNRYFPEVSKSALKYRFYRLDKARKYAKDHDYSGAMFPWQSGSDGSEATQTMHLNPLTKEWGADYSSYQRHISLAVAMNIWNYYKATNDKLFLKKYGAEVVFEICKFFSSLAIFNNSTQKYEIKNVMGPDEFHEKYPDSTENGLKDNSYTNIMVVWLLKTAQKILHIIDKKASDKLISKLEITQKELQRWDDMTKKINVVMSKDGIFAQFDGYFDLKELDWDYYTEKYKKIGRMDRILKKENKSPNEYKVAKQADTLMIFYNLEQQEINEILKGLNLQTFPDLLKRNFNYYFKRTSHGSTLSKVVHAYLAKLIGKNDLSNKLYNEALESDYNDVQGGTTGEGIHTGVMAATVLIALKDSLVLQASRI